MGLPSHLPGGDAPDTDPESGIATLLGGRFELTRQLGEGGFGTVYEAVDGASGERVALKLLRHIHPEALLRFKQEFRALQGLQHRNLVHLQELFEDRGRWFFTMELLEGQDLLSYLTRSSETWHPLSRASLPPRVGEAPPRLAPGSCDVARLRAVLIQLAEGLQALHGQGKIHRDLKPSNVWVTPTGRAVILDFGLVTETFTESETEILGTYEYMAPEQAASGHISPAVDWYAVGGIMYQALSGHLPFRGDAVSVMLGKQQQDPAPLLGSHPNIPDDLAALCSMLMQRDPVDRPSAREVLQLLGVTSERRPTLPPGSLLASGADNHQFVGRDKELSRLKQAYARASKGSMAICYVHGESGVGKSTLIDRFVREIADEQPQTLLLSARCYENETVPFKALDGVVDMLSKYLRQLTDHECSVLLPRRAGLLTQMFPVLGQVPAIQQMHHRPLQRADRGNLRELASASMRDLLVRMSDRMPIVVHIDDFQWADRESLALLNQWTRGPDAPAMLLVLTGQSLDECEPDVRCGIKDLLAQDPEHLRLALGGLSTKESRLLADKLLASADPERLEQVLREAGGHPMFIEVLSKHGMTASGNALEQALGARVQALKPESRHILELCAVAGVPVARGVLAEASKLSLNALGRQVAALQAAKLVRTRRARSQETVEPYHNRVRVAVLDEMDDTALMHAHRELAQALEGSEGADPERLAIHWSRAGDSQAAAKRAAVAADLALEGLAFYKAIRLFRWALELWPRGPDAQRSRTRLAESLEYAGRSSEAADAFRKAAAGALGAEAVDLQRRAAEQLIQAGRVDEGVAMARLVLQSLGLDLPTSTAATIGQLTWLWTRRKLQGDTFEPTAEKDVDHQELARIDVLWSLGAVLGPVDPLHSAALVTQQALRAMKVGEPKRVARALATDAFVAHILGSGEELDVRVGRAREVAEGSSDPSVHAYIDMVDGLTRLWSGDFSGAHVHLRNAVAGMSERCTGMSWQLLQTRQAWLSSALWSGDLLGLRDEYPGILQSAQERGDASAPALVMLYGGAAYHLCMDNPHLALRELGTSLQSASGAVDARYVQGLMGRINVECYGLQDTAAQELVAQWPTIRRSRRLRIGRWSAELHYHHAVALLNAAGPGDRRAMRAARKNLRALRSLPHRHLHCWAHLLAANVHVFGGDRDAAVRSLQQAQRSAESAGNALVTWRAQHWAQALRGQSTQQPLSALREQGVAEPLDFLAAFVPVWTAQA